MCDKDLKKIRNPYAASGSDEYRCFGCSPFNDKGLQLDFMTDGEEVIAHWNPQKWAEGYRNILHGGIQATLLDEVSSWAVQTLCKTVGVTASMEITYRKPVLISDGTITLKAKVTEQSARLAVIDAKLLSNSGVVSAQAKVKFFLFPHDKAISDFNYPGWEAFIGE